MGGMEAPGPLVVARIPSVNVPVCVVSKCVFTSLAKCVLQRAHSVGERLCVKETPSVRETPCVRETACVSEMACVEMDRRVQTRDGNSEPKGPLVAILRTAPVSRDVACEARSAFRKWPSRVRFRTGIPVRERPAFRKRPLCGRLKWWRGLGEFGTRGFPRGHVSGASHAAYRVFCSRSAQSGFPGR